MKGEHAGESHGKEYRRRELASVVGLFIEQVALELKTVANID